MSCPNTGVWVKIGTFISSPTSSAEGSCSACKKRLPDGCHWHESCSGDVGDSLYIGPEHCRWSTNTLYRESLDIRWDLTGAFRKRVPGSAQLCRGRSFGKKTGYWKSMAYRKVFDGQAMKCWSCEVHQRINTYWLRCQRTDMKESMHNWLNNAPMNQLIKESMNQWINEARKQWIIKSMNRGSMNQWNRNQRMS